MAMDVQMGASSFIALDALAQSQPAAELDLLLCTTNTHPSCIERCRFPLIRFSQVKPKFLS